MIAEEIYHSFIRIYPEKKAIVSKLKKKTNVQKEIKENFRKLEKWVQAKNYWILECLYNFTHFWKVQGRGAAVTKISTVFHIYPLMLPS